MSNKEIKCNDCGLRYEVIYSMDWYRANGVDMPNSYCPACGSEDLEQPHAGEEGK